MAAKIKDRWIESHELAHELALDELERRSDPQLRESLVSAYRESLVETGSAQSAAKDAERFLEANALFEFDDDG
ncbi:hypothetical protein ACFL2H_10170, partial [Planctomycetota bacterium]